MSCDIHDLPDLDDDRANAVISANIRPCEVCNPTPVTRAELIARAQAHVDARGWTRSLTMRHYRQALSICRSNGLATEDEILAANRNVARRRRQVVAS